MAITGGASENIVSYDEGRYPSATSAVVTNIIMMIKTRHAAIPRFINIFLIVFPSAALVFLILISLSPAKAEERFIFIHLYLNGKE